MGIRILPDIRPRVGGAAPPMTHIHDHMQPGRPGDGLRFRIPEDRAPPSKGPAQGPLAGHGFWERFLLSALCWVANAYYIYEGGDYGTYRHTYLMPPLTGARTPMTRPAGVSSSGQARARAADVPSTSGAGTSRGGGRPVPPISPTYPHPGWPDMPTELMAWHYGAISPTPIPLEPPMPSDRYAIDPDSPLPPRGYMEEVVGLVATLKGMVLRREAQLSIAGIQMPSWSGQPQVRPPGPPWGAGPSGPFHGVGSSGPFQGAGPSRPFRGAGPSRPFRGARGGSSRRPFGFSHKASR
ncbi:uncharacterized protein LOC114259351 [Camellia sinensis]|uniref:uncharacterized protein LOC114259351 n=1 Tax=Camellia sinensis TaxID=4442 RepID=UPI0010369409|nr:uncharacterized protein LOC114259351 [Camellia sinensis]